MQLIEVDGLDPQTPQAVLESSGNVVRVEVPRPLGEEEMVAALCCQDHLAASALQYSGEELLAVPPAVSVGGVDEVDAEVYGPMQRPQRLLVIRRAKDLPADGHGAESHFGHSHARSPQRSILHGSLSPRLRRCGSSVAPAPRSPGPE